MKKILLLFCMSLGLISCGSDPEPTNKTKLEYELTVSGEVNILDSTVVAKIFRVFTNDSTKLASDSAVYAQDDELARILVRSLELAGSVQRDPSILEDAVISRVIDLVIANNEIPSDVEISPDLLAYYIYVIGYVKEVDFGLRFEVDKHFNKNWKWAPPAEPEVSLSY